MKKRTLFLLAATLLLLASCSANSSGGAGCGGEVCHVGDVVLAGRNEAKK